MTESQAPGELPTASRPSWIWLATVAVLCLVILAYGYFGDKETSAGDLASQLGYNLPGAIVIGGGLQLVFRKRESNRTAGIGFVVIYISLVVASSLATYRINSAFERVRKEIGASLSSAKASLDASAASPPGSLAQPNATTSSPLGVTSGAPDATNSHEKSIEVMGKVLKGIMNRGLAQRREYEAELDAIGWGTVLDGRRLVEDATLAGSRTLLQQARQIVEKYKGRTDQIYSRAAQDIETAELPSNLRQEMLNGYLTSLPKGKAQTDALWSMELMTLAEFEKAIDLLSARRGAWRISEGELQFATQSDLDLYNSYLQRIESISAEQLKIRNASQQGLQRDLNQLGR